MTADFILCAKSSTDLMMLTASIHLIEKNKSSHRVTVITSNNDVSISGFMKAGYLG